MRLINVETLVIHEFIGESIPPYAILSHTWGSEEVTFQEFQRPDDTIKDRLGYEKIVQCCKKALEYGLQYAWVDTCCIDKTSSAELSEAINSMFQWYERAKVCFAFLADVPPTAGVSQPAFAGSRWFTRGWTLQELLAPRKLDFFDSDWTFIADRNDMAEPVSEITGIDKRFIQDNAKHNISLNRGAVLAIASVAERMSWAANRETTKEEDIAYCLLGLFGVNMPLIYGEGEKAFLRLQEEILRNSSDASILAWDLPSTHGKRLPQALTEYSPWRQAWRAFFGLEHPWFGFQQDNCSVMPIPALASKPEAFHGWGDMASCNFPLDCTLTNQGLHLTLPVSEGRFPYAIIPCHRRSDPWSLLALPLQKHESGGYTRVSSSAKMISHDAWHRWPKRRILLRARKMGEADTFLKPTAALRIQSMSKTMRLTHTISTVGILQGADFIDVQIPLSLISSKRRLVAALFEDDVTNEAFAIIIEIVHKPRPHLWTWKIQDRLGRHSGYDIECRFLKAASEKDLPLLVETPSDLQSLPRYLFAHGSLVYPTVLMNHLLDLPVFEVTIQEASGISGLFSYRLRRFLEESPGLLKKLLPGTDVFPDTTSMIFSSRSFHKSLGLWLSVFLLYILGVLSLVYRMWHHVLRESINSILWLVSRLGAPLVYEDCRDQFPIPRVYQGLLAMLLSYCSLPLLSCFFPRPSRALRDNQWTLLAIVGITASTVSPIPDIELLSPHIIGIVLIVWIWRAVLGVILTEDERVDHKMLW